MKFVPICAVIFVLLIPLGISAQSPDGDASQLYEQAQRAYFDLKSDQSNLNDRSSWQKILDSYELIIKSYPNDPLVDDITFISGGLLREMYQLFGDREYLDKAIEHYRTILRDFPDSYLQQAALFAVGEVQEKSLNSPSEAYETYAELVKRFPRGYKTAAARDRMVELDAQMAKTLPDAEQSLSPEVTQSSEVKSVEEEKSSGKQESMEDDNGGPSPFETGEPKGEKENPAAGGGESEEWSLPQGTETIEETGGQATITDIRTSFGKNTGRVVIELSREVPYSYKQLPAPNRRIYFDLKGVNLASSKLVAKELPISNRYLQKIRFGQYSKSVARVVLEFSEFREYKVFAYPAPFRIVFDLYGAGKGPGFVSAAQKGDVTEEILAEGADSNRDGKYSIARQLGAKVSTIVIDPGHGGKDPGTKGFNRLTESRLNLDIAMRLKRMIENEIPGVRVKLTRESDVFIPLDQRPAIAKSEEADLFFSIHSNAARRGRASGIESYYMNFASDKEAEELAAKENALNSLNQAKLSDLLKKITLNSKKEESRELALFIQHHLYEQTKGVNGSAKNRGVKSAPFVVLIGTEVPSVLVEVGFINHPKEGKLLTTTSYRDRIARGLLDGIKAYIESLR